MNVLANAGRQLLIHNVCTVQYLLCQNANSKNKVMMIKCVIIKYIVWKSWEI